MSTAIQTRDKDRILEQVISKGDLADLTPADRVSYYNAVCVSLGLNPLTKPFDFIKLQENGKEVIKLYARKDATEQLRKINGISIWKIETDIADGCLIVTAYAKTPDGREDIDEGIVYIKGKVGDSLANLQMKAITKAKRRVTLSICGLGFLDESEIDSIPNAQPLPDPEQEAVMTEQESLTLTHKASGLDQWKCDNRALAMQIITVCNDLHEYKITDDIIKSWLPAGVTSRKDLSEGEARYFLENLNQRLKLMELCAALASKGVDRETLRMRLPNGAQSLLTLTNQQVEEAIKNFAHWLKAYEEGVASNG
jgi:hypothetical protein